ncbi:MAG: hypothetical protein IKU12_02120, partial [Oscillospiraceae bacterium]|nr:hypothetical protein [Oscillospiraceae bacterium]
MMVKELLGGIGDINDTYILEAEEYKERTRGPQFRRVLILAAVLTALLALSAAAVTGNWFGLRELILGDAGEKDYDMISLVGLAQSPEYLAAAEWQEFLSAYDTDGRILESVGNGIFAPGTPYLHYNVYSQEMADTLDEIAAKYQLKLHTDVVLNLQKEELFAQVGGDFLGNNHAIAAYMYEDGTFHFDGDAELVGYGLLDFQFDRVVKGGFYALGLNIGSAEDYTQWNYTTQEGTTLLLAISPYKGLIVADLEDCFITVNVLAGTETKQDDLFSDGPLTAEDLQRLADSFRFSVLTPSRSVEIGEEELAEGVDEQAFYHATGIGFEQAQLFYSEFLEDIENENRLSAAEKILYPATVTMRDGTEVRVENALQMLEHYDAVFTEELWEQ